MRPSPWVVQRADGKGHVSIVPSGADVLILVDSGYGARAAVGLSADELAEVIETAREVHKSIDGYGGP